jgi:DNA-binding transcriptional MerR regulator
MNNYTIGQVSNIVGLPTKTIRFYEEAGVLSPAARSENGYRTFPQSAIEELKVIKYARDLDLPLSEIKKLMKGCCEKGKCSHSQNYLKKFVADYLALITKKIQELSILQTRLQTFQKNIETVEKDGTYCCDIFHQIIDSAEKRKGGE